MFTVESVDSLTTDQRKQWREVRKDLEDVGITVAAFEANKEFILDFLKEAVEAGVLEEKEPVLDAHRQDVSEHKTALHYEKAPITGRDRNSIHNPSMITKREV